MKYTATSQRRQIVLFLIIGIGVAFANNNGPILFSVALLLFNILCFISLFLKYELTLNQNTIHYQITIWGKQIYRSSVQEKDITFIRFKRVGWASEGAIIYLKRGIPIRIIRFSPDNVLENLKKYSFNHNLTVS